MSEGRSVRNEISVEPGLPKIVVSPCRRITSKAASRTVRPARVRPSPLPVPVALSTPVVWLIGPDATGARRPRPDTGLPCPVVFAYRTDASYGGQTGTKLGLRSVAGARTGGHPGLRLRAPRTGP